MNEEKLIWGAGFIDDDIVCEAMDYKPRRIRLAPWACVAAAVVVLVTAIAVIARQIGKPPVLPPDSSGIGTSTGLPEYTAGTGNWSLPNDPPDYSKSPNNSTDTSMSTVTTVDIDPEPQPVDIGNGMTLVGTPILSRDEYGLVAFPMTFDYSNGFFKDEAKEFIDELGVPGLSELTGRTLRLTRYCLSPIDMPWADAMYSPDGSMPPYIQTANGRYFETGYAYESCRTEYTLTFTKENVEEIFQKYDVFLNYNGELFCSDRSRGGQVGVVRREYELISKSDTVIEFRELIFYKDNDDKPAAEYVPELRNEYELGITDFKFVLTEDGWRAANIPVEYRAEQSVQQKAYDNTFEEFYPVNPTTYGPPPTAEEVVNRLKPVPDYPEYDLDSYYLVEVIRALTNEEYMQMNGAKESSVNGYTVYEVRLVEDLISGKESDSTAYVLIPAGNGARIQLHGDPTYAPGEKFTAALSKPCEGYDFLTSVCDSTLRYDIPEMDFTPDNMETMLYYRGGGLARAPQPIADLPFETEEIELTVVTSTSQNPVTYIQKIALDDLVQFLREQWQRAGISSHFES